MSRALKFLLALLFAGTAAACEFRPLEDPAFTRAKIKIEVDWSHFPAAPTGMTLMLFGEDGKASTILSNNTDYVYVELPEGHYRIYVFNQSTDEFSTMWFWNMDTYESPEAVLMDAVATWYDSKAEEDSRTVDAPEDLGVAVGEFDVSGILVAKYREYQTFLKSKTRSKTRTKDSDPDPDEVTYDEWTAVVLHPLDVVLDLQVTAYLSGIQNLRQARASLTGMTEGYMLTKGRTSSTGATQLLEDWEKYVYPEDNTKGYIRMRAQSTTFGFPSWDGSVEGLTSRAEELNVFTLECLLRDNKTVRAYPFNVGHRFSYEVEDDAVRVRLFLEIGNRPGEEILLPDVPDEPDDGAGGFSAEVGDWEDGDTETVLF